MVFSWLAMVFSRLAITLSRKRHPVHAPGGGSGGGVAGGGGSVDSDTEGGRGAFCLCQELANQHLIEEKRSKF